MVPSLPEALCSTPRATFTARPRVVARRVPSFNYGHLPTTEIPGPRLWSTSFRARVRKTAARLMEG